MKYLCLNLSIFLLLMRGIAGYYSTVECPPYSATEIPGYRGYDFSPLDCTLLTTRNHPFDEASAKAEFSRCLDGSFFKDDSRFDRFPGNGYGCAMKLKVALIRNWDSRSVEKDLCSFTQQDSTGPNLMPVPGNCSLFYKCDWGSAVLFECPADLHFNSEHQICDWPWKARCDPSWNGCPRPYPHCPPNYSQALYLPHPHRCDKFYQCEWGAPRLRSCPTGLHFDPTLKICDWPYKANCQIC